jgi:hypothetical protein
LLTNTPVNDVYDKIVRRLHKFINRVGFEVLTVVVMKSSLLWNAMPCSLSKLCLLALFYDPEDGGDMFFRDVDWLSTDYTELCPRR